MLDDKDEFENTAIVSLEVVRSNVRRFITGTLFSDETIIRMWGEKGPFTRTKGLRMAGRYLVKCSIVIDGSLRRVLQ